MPLAPQAYQLSPGFVGGGFGAGAPTAPALGIAAAGMRSSVLNKQRLFQISKELAGLLRHRAQNLGIRIRADGYCSVAEVLTCKPMENLRCTLEELQEIVRANDKQRFQLSFEGGEMFIRATQGHSMKAVADESLLRRLYPNDVDLPHVCVHGTYRRHLQSIMQKGLMAGGLRLGMQGNRNHVHFAPCVPGSHVMSGLRANCEVAIFIDLKRALMDGLPFYLSTNQVILSSGIQGVVPPHYIMMHQMLQ